MFASVGADGSVRMFDLRHLEHSTIIYEDPQHTPLLRLAWNKQDPNYLSTVAMDSCEVIILDVRVPCTPVARLNNHRACVNGIAWAPHSSCHVCTAGRWCHNHKRSYKWGRDHQDDCESFVSMVLISL